MMKTFIFLKVLHLLLIFSSSSGSATETNPPVTEPIIINDPEWPPYFFAGQTHEEPGLMKELLSHCLDQLKIPYRFKYQPIERMQVGFEQGTVDMNIFSYKPEREKIMDFGKLPILVSSYYPIVRQDSTIKIKKIGDFDPLKLGHTIGLRYSKEFYEYIQARKAAKNLDESSKEEFNLRKLDAGRIDIFVSTDTTSRYVAERIGLLDRIKILPFKIQSADYFIALSKASPRIADRPSLIKNLEGCYQKMKKSGEFCQLEKKYHLSCTH